MGQYWTMKNLDKRQSLNTHAFGSGLKYMEQWFSGSLYTALMVLLTDLSSLGNGGGDFRLDEASTALKKFIEPVIGSWAGNRVVFSGDYTTVEEYEETDQEGNESFEDISEKTALAIWTMLACDMISNQSQSKETERQLKQVKIELCKFLKENVCSYQTWEDEASLKPLLATIDNLISCRSDIQESAKSRKARKRDREEDAVPTSDDDEQVNSFWCGVGPNAKERYEEALKTKNLMQSTTTAKPSV